MDLQAYAGRLFGRRLADCTARVAGSWHKRLEGEVKICRTGERIYFRGLWQCGRVWLCPLCAERISKHRREDLQNAIDYATASGRGVALLTITQRHNQREALVDVLDRFARSARALKSGKGYVKLKARYGIVGEIRTLEVTYGRNGWHVHSHAVLILHAPLGAEGLADLEGELTTRWRQVCARYTNDLPTVAHGVDLRAARHNVAGYVAKWGFSDEIASLYRKRGHDDARTPWQLLAAAAAGDRLARDLWLEYAHAFDDRRQLVWTRGLRQQLGLVDELVDQEVLDLEDRETVVIASIDLDSWALVLRGDARADLLDLARDGRHAVYGYLNCLRSELCLWDGRRLEPRLDWEL